MDAESKDARASEEDNNKIYGKGFNKGNSGCLWISMAPRGKLPREGQARAKAAGGPKARAMAIALKKVQRQVQGQVQRQAQGQVRWIPILRRDPREGPSLNTTMHYKPFDRSTITAISTAFATSAITQQGLTSWSR